MDRVLITGGTGFIGHWLAKRKPFHVSLYMMGKNKYNLMEWYNQRWDAIIHLAPIAPDKVIECAKRNKARLLYASSGAVYHPENHERETYRLQKIMYEQDCQKSGVDVVIARLFTFFGDKLDQNKAYSRYMQAAKQNSDIEIWGDGSTVRSYMHGSEMARWLWAILRHGVSGEAYDVGSDVPITMLELAKMIKAGHSSKSRITFRNDRDPMPFYLPPNTEKTRQLLRYELEQKILPQKSGMEAQAS